MNQKPTVSAIIIFLNAEKFIEEAIQSVLAQTYEDWELLLVDDGSTDQSTQIAQHYAEQNKQRVFYLEHQNHQNRGMSASRNLGIRHARGKYIAFLDADDVWLPQKLEYQVRIMNAQPEAGMVYGNTLYWYSWTGDQADQQLDHIPPLGVAPNTLVDPPQLLQLYLSGKAAVPCTCSILVRHEVIERIGGFEESFRGMYEDQAFYTKICLTEPVYVTDVCLDQYRQHADSSCYIATNTGQANTARLNFLDWIITYLVSNQNKNPAIWMVLRRELWLNRQPVHRYLTVHTYHMLRRMKKWLLWLEEKTIPTSIRYWLWSRV
jgi:glycosyltransferase involved in cell wall biosynthesis